MRFFYATLIALLLAGATHAQVYTKADPMPEPSVDIGEHMIRNLKYPVDARDQGIVGKVIVKFIINESGIMDSIWLHSSVYPSLDSEAIRVIKLLPPWKPGMIGGKPVKVSYNLPIRFELSGVPTQDLTRRILPADAVRIGVNYVIQHPDSQKTSKKAITSYGIVKYLDAEQLYDEEAIRRGVTGDLTISFVIDEHGNAGDFVVRKPLFPILDTRALNALKLMPKWEPATIKGKPVASPVSITFCFRINGKSLGVPRIPVQGPVLTYADQMPESRVDIRRYIAEHTTYPEDAATANVSGKVTLRFIVTRTGNIDSISVLKPLYPSIDSMALSLVRDMPVWIPGKQNGEDVNVWYTLPLQFSCKMTDDTATIAAYPDFSLENYIGTYLSIQNIPKNVDSEGDVIVAFIVNPDGTTGEATIKQSLHPEVDKEALRLVEMMPKWKPARKNGVPVASRLSLPIYFNMKELRKKQ